MRSRDARLDNLIKILLKQYCNVTGIIAIICIQNDGKCFSEVMILLAKIGWAKGLKYKTTRKAFL